MQHISFYDLIITRARGKSGPLFHFDVHDDVRLVNDVRVEKDESHPGLDAHITYIYAKYLYMLLLFVYTTDSKNICGIMHGVGKVVERRWYEQNKHIFPASRWEIYDPNVARDAIYTIHGGEVINAKKLSF